MAGTETLAHGRLIAPQHGRWHSWRRDEPGDERKHLADEAGLRPVRHRDGPAGPAHTDQFLRDEIGARREHGPEDARHHIEAGVRIGQRFGVAFVELGRKRLRLRALPRGTNRVGRNVDAGHPDSAPCRDQGKLAGPAGHIEQRRTLAGCPRGRGTRRRSIP